MYEYICIKEKCSILLLFLKCYYIGVRLQPPVYFFYTFCIVHDLTVTVSHCICILDHWTRA